MYKFNNTSIFTGYIKQLLSSFNLPMCKVLKENESPTIDGIYIQGNKIIKYTNGTQKILSHNYRYGDYVYGLTTNLKLDSLIYDSYTHKYLGEYLRFYRDYKGINLMSMYNLYANSFAQKLEIKWQDEKDNNKNYSFTSSDSYKIITIPVRFNTTYTLAVDSPQGAEMLCCLYANNKVVSTSQISTLYVASYKVYGGLYFNQPITFTTPNIKYNNATKTILSKEKILTLLIKLPKSCESSITILEGSNFNSNPQLLCINDNNSYPFANKLIDYIMQYAITPDDEIQNNIVRLQKTLLKTLIVSTDKILYAKKSYYIVDENNNYNTISFDNDTQREDNTIYYERALTSINTLGIWDVNTSMTINKIIKSKQLNKTNFDILPYCDNVIEANLKELEE